MLSSILVRRERCLLKEVVAATNRATTTKCSQRRNLSTVVLSSQSQLIEYSNKKQQPVNDKRYISGALLRWNPSSLSSSLHFSQQQQPHPIMIYRQTTFSTSAENSSSSAAADPPPFLPPRIPLSEESIEKVDVIFKKILWLDMIEIHLLTELVNEKLGLHLTPKQRQQLQKAVDKLGKTTGDDDADKKKDEEEAAPAKKVFEVKLLGFDAKSKIKVIKEVRTLIAGLGLKEAKELVESVPKILQKDVSEEQAQEMKQKLEDVGAQVELV